jgi:NTP pyrophosphatase (non-canonical NTP hydrolase)
VEFDEEDKIKAEEMGLTGERLSKWLDTMFIHNISLMTSSVHKNAVEKGWYENSRSDVESIALMITELSEAIEAIRNGNLKDKHCPEFDNLTIELADCIIRIFDFCGHKEIDIGSAILAKHEANRKRSHKHGGKVL